VRTRETWPQTSQVKPKLSQINEIIPDRFLNWILIGQNNYSSILIGQNQTNHTQYSAKLSDNSSLNVVFKC
jgi:hypothetical protein